MAEYLETHNKFSQLYMYACVHIVPNTRSCKVTQVHKDSYRVQGVARPGIGMNVYGLASQFILKGIFTIP